MPIEHGSISALYSHYFNAKTCIIALSNRKESIEKLVSSHTNIQFTTHIANLYRIDFTGLKGEVMIRPIHQNMFGVGWTVAMTSDLTMLVELPARDYYYLGVEGRSVDRSKNRFIVEIGEGGSVRVGERLEECFKDPVQVSLVAHTAIVPELRGRLQGVGKTEERCIEWCESVLEECPIPAGKDDVLEWAGLIACGCTEAFNTGDPFLRAHKYTFAGSPSAVYKYEIKDALLMPRILLFHESTDYRVMHLVGDDGAPVTHKFPNVLDRNFNSGHSLTVIKRDDDTAIVKSYNHPLGRTTRRKP